MPQYYGGDHHNKERDATPAAVWRDEMELPTGVFRCERCDRVMPEKLIVDQDGYQFCRPLCADASSFTEQAVQRAEEEAVVDNFEPNQYPATRTLANAVSVTSHTTFPVQIVNDGASVAVTFTGIGFTSATTIAYGDAGITDNSGPTITSTLITLDLVASGVTPGYYNITIEGGQYTRVLRVVD